MSRVNLVVTSGDDVIDTIAEDVEYETAINLMRYHRAHGRTNLDLIYVETGRFASWLL